ncbi:MAG: M10 family metallopeptidase C-terminal domain-containing protein [Kaiparowitsia implicata GSE-PSE-MK54-09C]|jgi:Ca2+-binding RTX toxin-like protein|nr:M10 family metallopeptidase C-terminal domain-containing protein [Kaiparowitsia implicata GSE-PSE-MK54-09C]
MAGWPDSTNTGVPDGVTLLPSGSIIVTKPGTVISGLDIKGNIYIDADNVTVENCRITSSAYSVVQIKTGSTGVVIQDCEINGVGSNNEGSHGINGVGTFLRNDIYNVENGINVGAGSGTVIEGNYIHDLKASGSPHYDGIQIDGGQSDIRIDHNTIINPHGQTAAIMIDNYFGPVSNVVVNDNLLVGGGYTIYADAQFGGGALSGVEITNNHIGSGYYGSLNTNKSSPVYTGNTLDGHDIAATLNGNGNDTSGGDTGISEPVAPPTAEPAPVEPTAPTAPTGNTATSGADRLTGDDAANVIDGLGGNDIINGSAGNDTLIGGAGYDTLTGGAGNDVFVFRSAGEIGDRPGARDIITDFAQGQDKVDLSGIDANSNASGNQAFTFIAGDGSSFTGAAGELAWHTSNGNTIIQGDRDGDRIHDFEMELRGEVSLKVSDLIGAGTGSTVTAPIAPIAPTAPEPTAPVDSNTTITGTARNDRVNGDSGDNYLAGLAGDDQLNGGAGNDVLDGGPGRDYLTGGAANDIFMFKSVADMGMRVNTRDVITDFVKGQDKIDLSALDANTNTSGNQAFSLLTGENQAFSKTAGELAWRIEEGRNQTIIQGDANGDGVHDFELQLTGQIQLSTADFIL